MRGVWVWSSHSLLHWVAPVEEWHGVRESKSGPVEDADSGQGAKLLLKGEVDVGCHASRAVQYHRGGTCVFSDKRLNIKTNFDKFYS